MTLIHPLQLPPRFEAHITVPRLPFWKLKPLFNDLAKLGFPIGVDHFRSVINVDRHPSLRALVDRKGVSFSCSTPTGHDLQMPGAMLTIKAKERELMLARAHAILEVLARHVPDGYNFEIEALLSSKLREPAGFTINDFPGYLLVQNAPVCENHIGWNGGRLPANREIVQQLIELTGIAPHQIVGFSEAGLKSPAIRNLSDRVVTFYQPSIEATLDFVPILRRAGRLSNASYVIAEEVCIVGEPIR